jgi:hypothetical protein
LGRLPEDSFQDFLRIVGFHRILESLSLFVFSGRELLHSNLGCSLPCCRCIAGGFPWSGVGGLFGLQLVLTLSSISLFSSAYTEILKAIFRQPPQNTALEPTRPQIKEISVIAARINLSKAAQANPKHWIRKALAIIKAPAPLEISLIGEKFSVGEFFLNAEDKEAFVQALNGNPSIEVIPNFNITALPAHATDRSPAALALAEKKSRRETCTYRHRVQVGTYERCSSKPGNIRIAAAENPRSIGGTDKRTPKRKSKQFSRGCYAG